MPRQPVTISIAPSSLRRAVTLSLAASVCLLIGRYGPPWLAVTAVVAFGAALWRDWRRETEWQLRWVPGTDGGWQQRSAAADDWLCVSLHCDYLGPWLIGLRVAGRRRWVWPDSASFDERRALRRVLIWSSQAQRDT